MYDGVVGIPMPRTIPAIAVRTSAATSELCARTITNWVNVIPSPVMVTQPMTMPAQAQAIATESVLRAPSMSAPTTFCQPIPARVRARSSAIGMHVSAPTSAHNGAE